MISPEFFMRLAIKKARQGLNQGEGPFGACIVKGESVVACCHQETLAETDITAHAEINAIREACQKLKTLKLSECTIYSSCEPCPMCFSAIHLVGIKKIYFGAQIRDAQKFDLCELAIPNENLKKMGRSPMELVGGLLREEVLELFSEWSDRTEKRLQ